MRVFGARLRTVLSRSVEKSRSPFARGSALPHWYRAVMPHHAGDLVCRSGSGSPRTGSGIVLGADVGTALMARILTFDYPGCHRYLFLSA